MVQTHHQAEHNLSMPMVIVSGVGYADQLFQSFSVGPNTHVGLMYLTQTIREMKQL